MLPLRSFSGLLMGKGLVLIWQFEQLAYAQNWQNFGFLTGLQQVLQIVLSFGFNSVSFSKLKISSWGLKRHLCLPSYLSIISDISRFKIWFSFIVNSLFLANLFSISLKSFFFLLKISYVFEDILSFRLAFGESSDDPLSMIFGGLIVAYESILIFNYNYFFLEKGVLATTLRLG